MLEHLQEVRTVKGDRNKKKATKVKVKRNCSKENTKENEIKNQVQWSGESQDLPLHFLQEMSDNWEWLEKINGCNQREDKTLDKNKKKTKNRSERE